MRLWLDVGTAVGVVVVFAVYFAWVLRSNRAAGTSGWTRAVRLTCPKCAQGFDYTFMPGASFTSFRLGTGRYMACPKCGKWSTFRLAGAPAAPPTPTNGPK